MLCATYERTTRSRLSLQTRPLFFVFVFLHSNETDLDKSLVISKKLGGGWGRGERYRVKREQNLESVPEYVSFVSPSIFAMQKFPHGN